MRFDDRLATVLHQPAEDAHDRAVRWRQLVDLVARSAGHEHSPRVATALELIRSDASFVSEHLRAAAARAIAAPSLPLELLRYFVGEALSVAAPVLAAVQLGEDQWRLLIHDAEPEVRRFISTLQPGVASADPDEPVIAAPARQPAEPVRQPAETARQAPEPMRQPPEPMRQPPEPVRETPQPVRQAQEPLPSISEVVARIERLRISREEHPAAPPVAPPPARPMAAPASSPGTGALFRWECDPSGEIAWVEGAPRGAFVGRSIARREGGEGVDEQVERAFALRAPFRDAELLLAGEGAVAGEWKISGVPAFNAGRFAGYRGVAVREPKAERAAPALRAPSDPDSLRELVHELKTPLTAIIGFAEIIESQLLGPANDAYRERAREIAGQARLLLAAIEDLDFAARSASAAAGERTVNLGAVVEGAMARLRESAATRGVTIETSPLSGDLTVAVAPELAERLVMRLCDAVVGQSDAGDHVGMSVDGAGARVRLSMDRPSRLASVSDEELFRPSASPSSAGYWLRLVRNLARMVGADLVTSNREIALSFPRP